MFSSQRCFTSAIKLRPYQEACLDACKNALRAGATRIGVSLPTGAGKTTVFISLLAQISPPPQSPSTSRALIIVNSIELARQAAAQAAALFPQWHVEIEQGSKHKASGNADVYVLDSERLISPIPTCCYIGQDGCHLSDTFTTTTPCQVSSR
jgi:ATP-dependent helicase IRC3